MKLEITVVKAIMVSSILLLTMFPFSDVQAANWTPVVGEESLRKVYSNKVAEWGNFVGEYCADGTGVVYAWGESFSRKWVIKDKNQVCETSPDTTNCYTFEQSTTDSSVYRAINTKTGERGEFTISYRKPKSCDK